MLRAMRTQMRLYFSLGPCVVVLCLLVLLAPSDTNALNHGRLQGSARDKRALAVSSGFGATNDLRPATSEQQISRSEASLLLPQDGSCSAQSPCGMKVCCSQYGFCGTSSGYCGTGCQANCKVPATPPCSGSSAAGRTVAYWQSTNLQHQCEKIQISQINTKGLTHLNFAFVSFDPSSFAIVAAQPGDTTLYSQFTALKTASLQTWISVGGGIFPSSTWSKMTSTSANRAAFISSLKSFMAKYGFQGADLDWEFPTTSADTANYVALVQQMRTSFGTTYGISVTLPADYGDLSYFDAIGMQPSVNFFNFMAYDINFYGQAGDATVLGHTDINDISSDSLPLWFDGLNPSKLNLGIAYYGRGYTLQSESCTTLGCAATGLSSKGPCTGSPGIMSLREIQYLINSEGLISTLLPKSMMKYITWGNQWIGYDDAQTIAMKTQWASSHCWGGTMIWSIDYNSGAGSGDPPSPPVSTTGSCGYNSNGGTVICMGSSYGNCCSSHGFCGSGPAYCGTGCQSGCARGQSTDGTCGTQNHNTICGNWTNSAGATGLCCSLHGYCGSTSDYCGTGCQSGPCT